MLSRIIQKIQFFALQERSCSKLALSCAVGVFIAFSPFMGFHTVMTFALTWLLGLNLAATFAVSCVVNNPWSMIPIYSADYLFGDALMRKLFNLDMVSLNPSWMSWVNEVLAKYCGLSDISFWSFMIGGNILGLMLAGITYPVMKLVFERVMRVTNEGKNVV
ncbi:MAG TPA: DUF2062 domain-containing protein [Candidatus Limnocylindria bacterium]|nr:DUF2062 domain-containing protein [Candidatus Limnocylindria bacterium]